MLRCVLRKLRYLQKYGYFPRNCTPNSELREFCRCQSTGSECGINSDCSLTVVYSTRRRRPSPVDDDRRLLIALVVDCATVDWRQALWSSRGCRVPSAYQGSSFPRSILVTCSRGSWRGNCFRGSYNDLESGRQRRLVVVVAARLNVPPNTL